MRHAALTIAGSDPSGGAGIQADLKVFRAFGVYGMAVITALTAQNTFGVKAVKSVPGKFIEAQIEAILDDVPPDAVKTGMLLTKGAVDAVADILGPYNVKNLVIDPVMVSSSGKRLLRKDAVRALVERLFPLAALVTPNADEAEVLTGVKVLNEQDVIEAASKIMNLGPKAVLIKGGHIPGEPIDYLYDGTSLKRFTAARTEGVRIHGAGCVFSAATTACLALGMGLPEALAGAKRFVTEAIFAAIPIGRGRVPLV